LTPPEKNTEFFSFFGLAGKLTSAFGPLLFGLISQWYGLRWGVLSLLVFFIIGGTLLAFVNENSAEQYSSQKTTSL
jgi:UMF1 family MFS transporter